MHHILNHGDGGGIVAQPVEQPVCQLHGQGAAAHGGNHQQDQVAGQQIQALAVEQRAARAEHGPNVAKDGVHAFKVEEHPANQHQDIAVDMSHNGGRLFQPFQQERLFQNQQDAEVHAPQQEVPAGAVPDAGQRPDNADVADLDGKAPAVAAKGDVDILLKPGA